MTPGEIFDTIVVGAGLAGLTAAYRLGRRGHAVAVLESQSRLGGQIHTELADGYLIEHGAEGFVAGGTATHSLIDDLGLRDQVIEQMATRTLAEEGGALVELGPGEAARRLGFQVPRGDLGRGIRSLSYGMAQLIDTLSARFNDLGGRIERGTPVVEMRRERSEIAVVPTSSSSGALLARTLIVAVPSAAAAPLLEPLASPAAELARAKTLSSVSVTLAYAASDVQMPLDASGVLLDPSRSDHGARAFSIVSSKFPGRAPDDCVMLRVFFRPRGDKALPDAAWVDRAASAVAPFVDRAREPRLTRVSRWADALPVHDSAHRERVARVDAALETLGAIRLAGSAFHGAGIEAAVASAERAAQALDLTPIRQ